MANRNSPLRVGRAFPVTWKQARVLMELDMQKKLEAIRIATRPLLELADEIEAEREALCGVSALMYPGGGAIFPSPLGIHRPANPARGLELTTEGGADGDGE